MSTLRHLDLFSGIAGFALAAQMVGGIETRQFVEINKFCQRVLKKHYPGIPIHDDIRTYTAQPGEFDLITFGFPCQDVSDAGKRQGIKEGTRSGLFYEAIRIVRLVRPRYIVVENVAALLSRGMGIVLAELSQAGYSCEWAVVSCADLGAAHLRERVWIGAYANSIRHTEQRTWEPVDHHKWNDQASKPAWRTEFYAPLSSGEATANANDQRQQESDTATITTESRFSCGQHDASAVAGVEGLEGETKQQISILQSAQNDRQQYARSQTEPVLCSSDDGFSAELASHPYLMGLDAVPDWLPFATDGFSDEVLSYRKEAIEALGNAVSPQVAAIPLQRVIELHSQLQEAA